MGSTFRKILQRVRLALRHLTILVGVALIVFVIAIPLAHGWLLRHELLTALDDASSVRVVEHSFIMDRIYWDRADRSPITYATVNLSPDQINSLRWDLPLTLDFSAYGMLKCIFEEHHYVEITRKDGSVLTLHICFHCGEIEVGKHYGIMPLGWYSSLHNFISSIGLHPDGPWDRNPEGPK